MEEVQRKSALKTSPIPLFDFDKYPKTANRCMKLLKISHLKVIMKNAI